MKKPFDFTCLWSTALCLSIFVMLFAMMRFNQEIKEFLGPSGGSAKALQGVVTFVLWILGAS